MFSGKQNGRYVTLCHNNDVKDFRQRCNEVKKVDISSFFYIFLEHYLNFSQLFMIFI